jgi:4-hydroxyproline epimerase
VVTNEKEIRRVFFALAGMTTYKPLRIIDSHTGGEPTRMIVEGCPNLGPGTLEQHLARLREEHDWVRRAVVNEPRGSDVMVGAIVGESDIEDCIASVIFFNNVGYLGMCGHGTIGVVKTLAYLGRLNVGVHRIETPVGIVTTELLSDGRVSVENVVSYRTRKNVTLNTPELGEVAGDVAWGGNWFFLVSNHGQQLKLSRADELTEYCWLVRRELQEMFITGDDGSVIDHVELFSDSDGPTDSKNFVLCPGKEYDRSPCGTGLSAKIACLADDGKLAAGEVWRQESIVGSVFEATYRRVDNGILPTIIGTAYVNGVVDVLFDPDDPFRFGLESSVE